MWGLEGLIQIFVSDDLNLEIISDFLLSIALKVTNLIMSQF